MIKQKIIHVDRKNLTCMVESAKGNRYPVSMAKYLADGVQIGDMAHVVKSRVSHEWIMIDYDINTEAWSDLLPGDEVSPDTEPEYLITLEDYL